VQFPDVPVVGIGLVQFEPVAEWYEFHVPFVGRDVAISFRLDEAGNVGRGPEVAGQIAGRLDDFIYKARQSICHQMLDLKNNTWRQDGEGPLSAEEFMARLTLQSVGIEADGSSQFFYEDGGLFWGHDVIVKRDVEGHFQRAYLFG
jgi:hypothetical protein